MILHLFIVLCVNEKIIFQTNEILRAKAIKCGFGFIDLYKLTKNSDGYSHNEMSLDSIHLNPSAYLMGFNNYLTLPKNYKINKAV